MTSFDIQSLYTNIPTSEAINIIIDDIFRSQSTFMNFSKSEFKELLNLATSDTYFFFNQQLYLQSNSLAMGSPLSAILANSYLKYHESIWLNNTPLNFKPIHYKRYMYDTFLLFTNKHQTTPFLNFLNNQLPNIKFTKEEEVNNALPFLDMLITKTSTNHNINIYRKPTFSNLSLNFFSHVPFRYKCNSIKTLIHRAYHLTSSYIELHKEFSFLIKHFNANLFPSSLVYSLIKKFLNKSFADTTPILTAPKQLFYIKLPFHDHQYLKLKNDLLNLLHNSFPQLDFTFVFIPNLSIGSFLSHKEPLPTPLRSSIIYKYSCGACSSTYVGSTSRQLSVRCDEHRGISPRTGMNLSSPSYSNIRSHSHTNNHPIEPSHFSILSQTNQPTDLKILESIHISILKPSLNSDSGPFKLQLN
jgi:hypothetical protein